MRKNNRVFVYSMIVTAIIGFSILMVMMFIGIKYYVGNSTVATNRIENTVNQEEKVNYEMTVVGIVRQVTDTEMKVFDIDRLRTVSKEMTTATRSYDANENPIPLSSFKQGDVVELSYIQDESTILQVKRAKDSWTKESVTNLKINLDTRKIQIGGESYKYTSNLFVYGLEGAETTVASISSSDVVKVQGVGDEIWQIEVKEAAAGIRFTGLPTTDGRLEIDRSRMIPLSQLEGTVDITPGEHKLVINMKGYETIIENVTIKSGEIYQYSLKDAKLAYTEVAVYTNNTAVDYTVKFGDQSFKKGEPISVVQGIYNVVVTAGGYHPWSKQVALEKEAYVLKVNLQPLDPEKEEVTEEEEEVVPTDGQAQTISISTDPVGAKVYIDGVQKGTTPYTTTLPLGSYRILLEKKDYEIYTTNILIESNSDQNNFLYVLTPEEN